MKWNESKWNENGRKTGIPIRFRCVLTWIYFLRFAWAKCLAVRIFIGIWTAQFWCNALPLEAINKPLFHRYISFSLDFLPIKQKNRTVSAISAYRKCANRLSFDSQLLSLNQSHFFPVHCRHFCEENGTHFRPSIAKGLRVRMCTSQSLDRFKSNCDLNSDKNWFWNGWKTVG